jgi:U3 small nucleolar RNA-associated protein 14
VDPAEELKKKLKVIEEIRRKRKDNQLAHVIIN